MESLMVGILSSTDAPELRIRRNRDGEFTVRVYAHNREKTAHGTGASIEAALTDATSKRGA
jgi:hypothetical protein